MIAAVGRKPGSIERKLQNVSGRPGRDRDPHGSKAITLAHYQDSLVAVVEQRGIACPRSPFSADVASLRSLGLV